MLDHLPPLCEGPGTIRSKAEGKISFRMHNQIKLTPAALSSLQWFKKDGTGLEPSRHVRIFADDYDGLSWVGGWSIPETHRVRDHESIVVGQFDQLSTQLQKSKSDNLINVTELVYGQADFGPWRHHQRPV